MPLAPLPTVFSALDAPNATAAPVLSLRAPVISTKSETTRKKDAMDKRSAKATVALCRAASVDGAKTTVKTTAGCLTVCAVGLGAPRLALALLLGGRVLLGVRVPLGVMLGVGELLPVSVAVDDTLLLAEGERVLDADPVEVGVGALLAVALVLREARALALVLGVWARVARPLAVRVAAPVAAEDRDGDAVLLCALEGRATPSVADTLALERGLRVTPRDAVAVTAARTEADDDCDAEGEREADAERDGEREAEADAGPVANAVVDADADEHGDGVWCGEDVGDAVAVGDARSVAEAAATVGVPRLLANAEGVSSPPGEPVARALEGAVTDCVGAGDQEGDADSAADAVPCADTEGEPEEVTIPDASLDALGDPETERDADGDADAVTEPELSRDAVESGDADGVAVPRAPLGDEAALTVEVAQDDAVARALGDAADVTLDTLLAVPALELLVSTDALAPADAVPEVTALRDAPRVADDVAVTAPEGLSLGVDVDATVARAVSVITPTDALADRDALADPETERGLDAVALLLAQALALAVPRTDAVLDRVTGPLAECELHALPSGDVDADAVAHAEYVARACVGDTVADPRGGDGDTLALAAREADVTSDPDGAARDGDIVALITGDTEVDGQPVPAAETDADGVTESVARGERVDSGDGDAVGELLTETLPSALAVSVRVGSADDDERTDPDVDGVADAHGEPDDSVVNDGDVDGDDDCDGVADAESIAVRVATSDAVPEPVDDESGDSLFSGVEVGAAVADAHTLALPVPVKEGGDDAEPVGVGAPLAVPSVLALDDSHAVAEVAVDADGGAVGVTRGDAEKGADAEMRGDDEVVPVTDCAAESLASALAVREAGGVRVVVTVADRMLDCELDALSDAVAQGDDVRRDEPLPESVARRVAETEGDPLTLCDSGAVLDTSGVGDAAIEDDGDDESDGDAVRESAELSVGAGLPEADGVCAGLELALPLGVVETEWLRAALSDAARLADSTALVLADARGEALLDSLRTPDADAETDALTPGLALSAPLADTVPLALVGAVADASAEIDSLVLALGLAVDDIEGAPDCVADADGEGSALGDGERVPCALGERADEADAALLAVAHAVELPQAVARGEVVGRADAVSNDDGETRDVDDATAVGVGAPEAVTSALGLTAFVAVPSTRDGVTVALGLEYAEDVAASVVDVVGDPVASADRDRAVERVPDGDNDALVLAVELPLSRTDALPRALGEESAEPETVGLELGVAVATRDGESGGDSVPTLLALTAAELVGGAREAVTAALVDEVGQCETEAECSAV